MLTPFERDRCMFVKLKGRLPVRNVDKDKLLLAAIRRVNLDTLWSRETTTVKSNLEGVRKIVFASASAGLRGPFKSY